MTACIGWVAYASLFTVCACFVIAYLVVRYG